MITLLRNCNYSIHNAIPCLEQVENYTPQAQCSHNPIWHAFCITVKPLSFPHTLVSQFSQGLDLPSIKEYKATKVHNKSIYLSALSTNMYVDTGECKAANVYPNQKLVKYEGFTVHTTSVACHVIHSTDHCRVYLPPKYRQQHLVTTSPALVLKTPLILLPILDRPIASAAFLPALVKTTTLCQRVMSIEHSTVNRFKNILGTQWVRKVHL